MNVLLVDDHVLFRHGLKLMLSELDDQAQIEDVGSVTEAVDLAQRDFQLILLDLKMPGTGAMQGIEIIRREFPESLVVVLSGDDDAATIRASIEKGAVGFIPKASTSRVMIQALRLILATGIYLPPQVLGTGFGAPAPSVPVDEPLTTPPECAGTAFTERQAEVLKLALTGLPNKLIARRLDISEGTVKSHLSSVFRILNVRNRTEALYRAAELGLHAL